MSETCGVPFFDVSAAFNTAMSDVNPCSMYKCVVMPKMAMRVPAGALSRNSINCFFALACAVTGVFR